MIKIPDKRQVQTFFTFFLITLSSISFTESIKASDDPLWLQPFRQCWAYPSENILADKIASDNVKAFIPYPSGTIEAIDIFTGNNVWTTRLGGETTARILTSEKSIFVINASKPPETSASKSSENPQPEANPNISISALDSGTGVTIWKKNFEFDSKIDVYSTDKLLIVVSREGRITLIKQEDGSIAQKLDLKQEVTSSDALTDKIILGTKDKIYVLSTADQSALKEIKAIKEINVRDEPVSFMLDPERIFWGDKKGLLNSSKLSDGGIIWKRRFGAAISNITDNRRGIFVSSVDNFVYLLNKTNGKIKWKRRLAARVTEKPFIKDNIALIFPFGESTALFINLNDGRIVNSLTLSDANYFTGFPAYEREILVFPTLKGLYAFGAACPSSEKTGV